MVCLPLTLQSKGFDFHSHGESNSSLSCQNFDCILNKSHLSRELKFRYNFGVVDNQCFINKRNAWFLFFYQPFCTNYGNLHSTISRQIGFFSALANCHSLIAGSWKAPCWKKCGCEQDERKSGTLWTSETHRRRLLVLLYKYQQYCFYS